MKLVLIAASALALGGCMTTTATAPLAPVVNAADAASIDATLDAVYAVISGPPGQARDWDKMRSLFTDNARLAPIGAKGPRALSLEEYIKNSGPFLTRNGFTEQELDRRVEVYGNLAHAWSSYDGHTVGPEKIRVRGINSLQLARQPDNSWKVYSILWHQEDAATPLPADMGGAR